MKIMKFVHIFSLLFLGLLASCGQDQLSTAPLYSNSLTDAAACGCSSEELPVCSLKTGKTYTNKCVALQCFNEKVTKVGSCSCSRSREVCLNGTQTMNECDAIDQVNANHGEITKYVACEKISM